MENMVLGNRYKLLEKISEGGMSTIYRAYCNVLNRIVAIKILKKEFSNDEEFLKKFNDEARSAASLNHPNIIGIYDVGIDNDVSYIVMEYVNGQNLKELVRENKNFDEQETLEILKQICLALNEAHLHKIVHRDIKPHNIMINNLGMIKVGDFGIAKAATSSTIVAKDDKIIGSVHYISPEQAKGTHVDERSDIYSLGIVFYELLTGKVPYNSENPVNIALKHIEEEIDFSSYELSEISPCSKKILRKMTQKNIADRYKNVSEIIKDIDNFDSNDFDDEDFNTKIIHVPKYDKDNNQENESELNNRNKNVKKNSNLKAFILSVFVVAVCILAFYFAYTSEFFNSFTGKQNVVIPNIEGKTIEKARLELKSKKLTLIVMSEKEDDKYEPGTIIQQNPQADLKIRKGEEISVIVAKEPDNTAITPSFNGLNLKEAEELAEEKNIKIKIIYEYSDDIEKDKIISQEPKTNVKIYKDDIVILKVSKGREFEKEKVPNLIGLSLNSAKKSKGKFKIGNVSYKEDKTQREGIVLYQNPKADEMEKIDVAIDLVINRISNSSSESSNSNSNNNNTKPKGDIVTKNITLVLPPKESLMLSVIDKQDSTITYSNKISTLDENFKVKVSGHSGETKKYDIFIDGQYYATTGDINF